MRGDPTKSMRDASPQSICRCREEKAYTTTTERKSFGELFWPQRRTFQAGGGYKNPIKIRKAISTTDIFPLWTPFVLQRKVLHWIRAVYGFFFPALGLNNTRSGTSRSATWLAIPGSPYRGQNWKIGKMTFLGSKNAFLGVPLGTI